MRKRKCGKEWLMRGRTFLGWQTGYVIGMESHRYYAGVQAAKIRCRPLWGATYFATRKQAEQTVLHSGKRKYAWRHECVSGRGFPCPFPKQEETYGMELV